MASEEMHKDFRTKHFFTVVLLMIFRFSVTCAQMNGFRIEPSDSEEFPPVNSDGQLSIVGGHDVRIRLFTPDPLPGSAEVSFTTESAPKGVDCSELRSTRIFDLETVVGPDSSSVGIIHLPSDEAVYMFCLRTGNSSSAWIHQGDASWLQLAVAKPSGSHSSLLPLWAKIVIVIALLAISALCTGLGITVLTLSRTELKLLRSAGTSEERHYAKAVSPLRKHGNRVLFALLFSGIFANACVAVLIEDMIQIPGAAMAVSAAAIILFTDIVPVIVSSQIGLGFAAKSSVLSNVFVVITIIFSYPLGRFYDWLLDDDLPSICSRSRLQCLQRMSQPNAATKEAEEENAARGGHSGGSGGGSGLALSTKSAKDLMTSLDNVFMVEYNAVLDENCLESIASSGYTRIPVYEKERTNIVAVLHVRDLAYVRAGDRTSLRTLCKFYNHPVNFVFEDTKLDVMLEEFKKGQSHMAFIQRVNTEGPGDPFYETLGMITLEDVIEDIFQSEIVVDPPDIIMDKKQVKSANKINKHNFARLTRLKRELSPQMASAVCQFLSTLLPFSPRYMSCNVISRLLSQDVVVHVHAADNDSARLLYERGKVADCFTLVVEGHVQIHVGNEEFVFDGGPFMYFGVQAIMGDTISDGIYESPDQRPSPAVAVDNKALPPYTPDYTVVAVTDLIVVRVSATQYATALRAAALERRIIADEAGSGDMDAVFAAAALNGGFACPSDVEIPVELSSMEATSRSQLLDSTNVGNINVLGQRANGSRTSMCDV